VTSPAANLTKLKQFLERIKKTYPQEAASINKLADEFQQGLADLPADRIELIDAIDEKITKAKALAGCLLAASYHETELNNEIVTGVAWTIEDFIREIELLQQRVEKMCF
jgi:hypothetical protein